MRLEAMIDNRCSCLSFLLTALLLTITSISIVSGQSTGVFLSLNGNIIPSDGYIRVGDIGIGGSGLYCNTDRSGCCRGSDAPDGVAQGHWYLPDGTQVGSYSQESQSVSSYPNFFSRDRSVGVVRLNRYGDPPERGRFRCEVPNADSIMVTTFVNIVESHVSPIISSGTSTAGESYVLVCTVTVTGSTDQPTITWLMGPMDSMITSGVITNGGISTLTFDPLSASHAGTYTCRATLGSIMDSVSRNITVQNPTITVSLASSSVAPIAGSMYSLTCTVIGAEMLTDAGAMVTYQWLKNGAVVLDQTMATLSFSPVTLFDAGSYTCQATVTSGLLSDPITTSISNSVDVQLTFPEPIVSVLSDSSNHVFYGHPPTLTCTVEITSVLNFPLSMTIVWKGPDGTVVASPTRPEMRSLTLYTSSSGQLTSIDSADSGEYTCMVRFEIGVEVSASTNITIVDGVFQLRLKSIGICQQYSESSEKRKLYSSSIKDAIVTAIKHHCKCHFPINNLNKDVFVCEDSPNVMIYRNALIGTLNFNGTQIVDFIQDWVSTGPLIEVDGSSMRVDSSCPTAISSLNEPVCGEKKECVCDVNPKYAMCAQHLADNNIANCFEGCVARNG